MTSDCENLANARPLITPTNNLNEIISASQKYAAYEIYAYERDLTRLCLSRNKKAVHLHVRRSREGVFVSRKNVEVSLPRPIEYRIKHRRRCESRDHTEAKYGASSRDSRTGIENSHRAVIVRDRRTSVVGRRALRLFVDQ